MPAFGRALAVRLDVYLLRLVAGPLALVLVIVLVAQLLERVLRLFDLIAASGAPLSTILPAVAHLVPHYLGLALPAAFTAAMALTVAQLSEDHELDVMLATGRSLVRLAVPYIALSLAFSAYSVYLFGYLQPLSRYAYRAAVHDALQTRWDARLEDNSFVTAGRGFTLTAESVEADGRRLHGVLLHRTTGDEDETITARHGRLAPAADGRRLLLQLEEGLILREHEGAEASVTRFVSGVVNEDFTPAPPPFRPRGGSVRELTSGELWHGMDDLAKPLPQSQLAGELHGRLARSVLLPLLPLLAIPLGMASRRGRRVTGMVLAFVALVLLNHGLQFGESLAESGRATVLVGVWSPVLLFAVLALWLFRSSVSWPVDNAATRAVIAVEDALHGLGRLAGSRR